MTKLEEFSSLINHDLGAFFDKYDSFVEERYPQLMNYYRYGVESVDITDTLVVLKSLKDEREEIYSLIIKNKFLLNTTVFYQITDVFENVSFTLDTLANTAYWMSVGERGGKVGYIAEYQLNQHESYEHGLSSIGYVDRDTALAETQLKDRVWELSYTLEGGTKINYTVGGSAAETLSLNTLVGPLMGKNVYGKDLKQKLSFVNEDLENIEGRDCFVQTCGILLNLKKGNNPEFYGDGFDKNLMTTRLDMVSSMPTLTKSLSMVVRKDDSIKDFRITGIRFADNNADAVYIDTEFTSQYVGDGPVAMTYEQT
jgi:hypothetical protein